jgi:hypothetical protein
LIRPERPFMNPIQCGARNRNMPSTLVARPMRSIGCGFERKRSGRTFLAGSLCILWFYAPTCCGAVLVGIAGISYY